MKNNLTRSYVFMTWGIGITPFRSMIKYLVDKNMSASITLFYAVRAQNEVVFQDLLEEASKQFGLTIVYKVGKSNPFTAGVINQHVKDINAQVYYLSGPQALVEAQRELLQEMSIPLTAIKTDLFTGYDEER